MGNTFTSPWQPRAQARHRLPTVAEAQACVGVGWCVQGVLFECTAPAPMRVFTVVPVAPRVASRRGSRRQRQGQRLEQEWGLDGAHRQPPAQRRSSGASANDTDNPAKLPVSSTGWVLKATLGRNSVEADLHHLIDGGMAGVRARGRAGSRSQQQQRVQGQRRSSASPPPPPATTRGSPRTTTRGGGALSVVQALQRSRRGSSGRGSQHNLLGSTRDAAVSANASPRPSPRAARLGALRPGDFTGLVRHARGAGGALGRAWHWSVTGGAGAGWEFVVVEGFDCSMMQVIHALPPGTIPMPVVQRATTRLLRALRALHATTGGLHLHIAPERIGVRCVADLYAMARHPAQVHNPRVPLATSAKAKAPGQPCPDVALFGLAQCLPIVTATGAFNPWVWPGAPPVPVYASVGQHLGWPVHPCDDLESLGYSMLAVVLGGLPWEARCAAVAAAVTHAPCGVPLDADARGLQCGIADEKWKLGAGLWAYPHLHWLARYLDCLKAWPRDTREAPYAALLDACRVRGGGTDVGGGGDRRYAAAGGAGRAPPRAPAPPSRAASGTHGGGTGTRPTGRRAALPTTRAGMTRSQRAASLLAPPAGSGASRATGSGRGLGPPRSSTGSRRLKRVPPLPPPSPQS